MGLNDPAVLQQRMETLDGPLFVPDDQQLLPAVTQAAEALGWSVCRDADPAEPLPEKTVVILPPRAMDFMTVYFDHRSAGRNDLLLYTRSIRGGALFHDFCEEQGMAVERWMS